MNIQKVSVKLFAQGQPPSEQKLIPVFHSWIQNDVIGGLLLDVVDYSHVPSGPGVMLIAESVNYGFESGADGCRGLVYASKESNDRSNTAKLSEAIAAVLDAAAKLQAEPDLDSLKFSSGHLKITVVDRRSAPNEQKTFDLLKPELDSILESLFDGQPYEMSRISKDAREALTIQVKGPEGDLMQMKERLIS